MDTSFNYFNLIKKCCTKLDLEVPANFASTTDDEYIKLKDCLNTINRLIVLSEVDRWSFRDQKTYTTLLTGQSEYSRPDGMITSIRYEINQTTGELSTPLIPEYRWNYLTKSSGRPNRYNVFGEKLLLYPTPSSVENNYRLEIKYATNNCATTSAGVLKPNMDLEGDYSLIPTQFSDVLIYGACLDYKAMPDKSRYQHYQQQYTKALKLMRSQMKRSKEITPYNDMSASDSGDDWVQGFFNSWIPPEYR